MTVAPAYPPAASLSHDRTALISMSERLVESCPDMREMARSIAREILSRQTGHDTEPDTVYWHRLHGGQQSTIIQWLAAPRCALAIDDPPAAGHAPFQPP